MSLAAAAAAAVAAAAVHTAACCTRRAPLVGVTVSARALTRGAVLGGRGSSLRSAGSGDVA